MVQNSTHPEATWTQLMEAAEGGVVTDELLGQAGQVLQGMYTFGSWNIPHPSALMIAAARGNTDAVARILPFEEGNRNPVGWTALMFSAALGHLECAKLLIREAGMCCNDGMTALLEAAQHGHADIVALLLEKEGDLVTTDIFPFGEGFTALMMAAKAGHQKSTELLIPTQAGKAQPDGWTALMWAAYDGRLECLKLLIPYEANRVLKGENSEGWTALIVAASEGHMDCVDALVETELEASKALLKELLENGDCDLKLSQIEHLESLIQ
ncbi:Ankyrin repeat protein 1 [Giardia muris]|uniref:Ankyrin repeat protein 1 n=1 Tax=Giardia muris TaxID=5742 RepID=A0A4Z1SMV0_GIAMU|nr:Ankyrin repeat protein 1 [Giardia muris]TNJ29232.1 Ankyrin repeat protein 1 [Giardia muris]|eukprot:TNJ26145.1 Ankyrin repeat protein 1 [Giardia muris]